MSGLMNPAEFTNIARSEQDFWWDRGMRVIFLRVLDPYLAERPVRRVLDAGSGTGYFSHLLEQQRGWPVVAVDLSAEGSQYARQLGRGAAGPRRFALSALSPGMVRPGAFLRAPTHLPRGDEKQVARELVWCWPPEGPSAVRTSALGFRAAGIRNSRTSGSASPAGGW